jgi:hypothetical protein
LLDHLAERPESAELAKVASVNFICPPEEARRRIKRVEQLGFEEILIGSQFGAIEEIEHVRDFVKRSSRTSTGSSPRICATPSQRA